MTVSVVDSGVHLGHPDQNDRSVPFVWTGTAADILAVANRDANSAADL